MTPLSTLPTLLSDRAQRNPTKIAIRQVDGREVTFGELNDLAERRAHGLIGLGVGPNTRVASHLSGFLDSYTSWLGTAKAGGVEVPINPQFKTSSLAHQLNDSQASVLFTTTDKLQAVTDIRHDLKMLESVVLVDGSDVDADIDQPLKVLSRNEFDRGADPSSDLVEPALWDTACITYTSGTTGPPKGVVIPWGQMIYSSMNSTLIDPDISGARYSFTAPFHMSGKYALFSSVLLGETLVLRDGFSLTNFWAEVRENGCTFAHLFPQLVKLLLREAPKDDDADNPLQAVACLPACAEIVEFKRRFGVRRVMTGFGMTEIGGPIGNMDADAENWSAAGKVLESRAGWQARIVDEHDMEVPRGAVGELVVRTAEPWATNGGYVQRPEATADAWRNGWFHTGDAMRQDEDGWYFYVDRKKDYIRRKGENVSSFEVEHYVSAHPAVAECAAVGVPSELGEEEIKVVIVLKKDVEVTHEAINSDLTNVMPRFMVPRYLEFVDEIPKTDATGRIQKHELRKTPLTAATWDREEVGRT